MQYLTATDFAQLARLLSATAKSSGLQPVCFRTPPRSPGRNRTLRRYNDGTALISIRTQNREREEIVGDMIEGIVHANFLKGSSATLVRRTLWGCVINSNNKAA